MWLHCIQYGYTKMHPKQCWLNEHIDAFNTEPNSKCSTILHMVKFITLLDCIEYSSRMLQCKHIQYSTINILTNCIDCSYVIFITTTSWMNAHGVSISILYRYNQYSRILNNMAINAAMISKLAVFRWLICTNPKRQQPICTTVLNVAVVK